MSSVDPWYRGAVSGRLSEKTVTRVSESVTNFFRGSLVVRAEAAEGRVSRGQGQLRAVSAEGRAS